MPLLVVLLYILYDVHYRTSYSPSALVSTYDDDSYDYDENDLGVSLTVILYIFLLAFVVLGTLTAYYAHFMSKRQELLEQYVVKGYVVNNANLYPNANVGHLRKLLDCLQCRFVGRYDLLTYVHPDASKACLEAVAASGDKSTLLTTKPDEEGWVVKKLVRRSKAVMNRQRQMNKGKEAEAESANQIIPIALLPGCPQSGMIRDDVEYDAAYLSHFQSSKRYKEVFVVLGFWMIITLCGVVYLVWRMGATNAQRDSFAHGFAVSCVTVLVITPAVAYGYNFFRWSQHEKLTTNSGIVTKGQVVTEISLMNTDSEDDIETGRICERACYSQNFLTCESE